MFRVVRCRFLSSILSFFQSFLFFYSSVSALSLMSSLLHDSLLLSVSLCLLLVVLFSPLSMFPLPLDQFPPTCLICSLLLVFLRLHFFRSSILLFLLLHLHFSFLSSIRPPHEPREEGKMRPSILSRGIIRPSPPSPPSRPIFSPPSPPSTCPRPSQIAHSLHNHRVDVLLELYRTFLGFFSCRLNLTTLIPRDVYPSSALYDLS